MPPSRRREPSAAQATAPAPLTTPISPTQNLPPDIEARARAELRRRHYCAWIADPHAPRCPRWQRTGQECLCIRPKAQDREWDWWPWRVLPPLRDENSCSEPTPSRTHHDGKKKK